MLAQRAAPVVLDGARRVADVAVQKLTKRPLANKANAGRILLLGVGQANFFGNAAHLGLVQLAHREQRFGQLRLVQPVQKIALVLARVQPLEQLEQARGCVLAHPRIVTGGNLLSAQTHGAVEKGLELDLGVAQHIGVGRAPGLVFAQKLGEHPVLVIGGEVDMLDLDANHIGHGGGIHEVDVGRAVLAVVVIFPVLHEDADHLVALLLEKVGGDGGVHAPREADDNALFGMGSHCPDCIFMRWPPCAGVQNA